MHTYHVTNRTTNVIGVASTIIEPLKTRVFPAKVFEESPRNKTNLHRQVKANIVTYVEKKDGDPQDFKHRIAVPASVTPEPRPDSVTAAAIDSMVSTPKDELAHGVSIRAPKAVEGVVPIPGEVAVMVEEAKPEPDEAVRRALGIGPDLADELDGVGVLALTEVMAIPEPPSVTRFVLPATEVTDEPDPEDPEEEELEDTVPEPVIEVIEADEPDLDDDFDEDDDEEEEDFDEDEDE